MTKSSAGAGPVAALQDVAATLVAMFRTRLELLGNELATEKLSAVRMLLLAQALMFCATVGVLLVVALVALLMWEHPLGVVAGFALLFVAAAVLFYRALMRMVNAPEAAFAASMAELQQDIHRLKSGSGNAAAPD